MEIIRYLFSLAVEHSGAVGVEGAEKVEESVEVGLARGLLVHDRHPGIVKR